MKYHTLKWFTNRIGQTIYRGKTSCPCGTCAEVLEKGLKILDEQHAEYLHMIQVDLEDLGIKYSDKKV